MGWYQRRGHPHRDFHTEGIARYDEIEPGWSQVIWRQAMQYHNMLKQKHEMEEKAVEAKVNAAKMKIKAKEDEKTAAETAAQELIAAEEREKQSKKAFSSDGGVKKGFLEKKK